MRSHKLLSYAALSVLFLIFWFHGVLTLDPDFGWHLKMGELISQSGIPKTDPFSYTMTSFPFVDHEWLTNVLFSKLYPIFGQLGMSAIFSFLTIATLLIMFPKKLRKWGSVPLLLTAAILLPFSGVRTQVITWFFLALLLRVLADDKLWKKLRWLTPLLFLLWANMHAGFAAGIMALLVVNVVEIVISSEARDLKAKERFLTVVRNDKALITDWLIFLLSLGATFINPYGARLWGEVWMQASDTNLHSSIGEWTPGIFYLDLAFLVLIALTLTFIFYRLYHKNFQPLKQLILFAGLFLAALSAERHIPLWTIAAAPLLALFFQDFYQGLKNDDFGSRAFRKCYLGLEIGVVSILLINFGLALRSGQKLSQNNFYPQSAIQFLRVHPFSGQLFSTYDWGGYLIWQYPEKKDFVDGRMPSWRRSSAPQDESKWAFKDYQSIVDYNGDITPVFNKYHVTTVLWPAPPVQKNDIFSAIRGKYNQLINSLFPKRPVITFPEKLTKAGWKKIYSDNVAVIYRKN